MLLFKYHLILDSMKTLQFWKNKPAKHITMIRHRIMGINNPKITNGLVQSYLKEAYVNALLSQVIFGVFEAKTKDFKGNIFPVSLTILIYRVGVSQKFSGTPSFLCCILCISLILHLNFELQYSNRIFFFSPYPYRYRQWYFKTMPSGLLWNFFWVYNAVVYFR